MESGQRHWRSAIVLRRGSLGARLREICVLERLHALGWIVRIAWAARVRSPGRVEGESEGIGTNMNFEGHFRSSRREEAPYFPAAPSEEWLKPVNERSAGRLTR